MPDATDIDFRELAKSHLSESALPAGLSDAAQEAHRDAAGLVNDTLAIAATAEANLAELVAKRDLVPATGYKRLLGEIVGQADDHASTAYRHFNQRTEALKTALTDDALPVLDRSREGLDREEVRVALGAAEGEKLVARALGVAQKGSYGATSVLFSPYVRTLFAARNVPNVDARIATLKTVAASVKRPEATPKERAAQDAMERIGKLHGAFQAAQAQLRRALKPHKQ